MMSVGCKNHDFYAGDRIESIEINLWGRSL